MSKFNQTIAPEQVQNLAGGAAHSQSPELEFVSILLTSFAMNQFYEKEETSFDRIEQLLPKLDPEFAAKAVVYGRTKFGMRSISHVAAVKLSDMLKGKPYARGFYDRVIHRPDDITEILSLTKGKVTHAMRSGLALAFDKFDSYQLAKYKAEGKAISMVDALNILHPVATDRNKKAMEKLIKGELKTTGTWEAKLSEAGQKAESEEEKETLKAEAWKDLITSRKIGYFALLRNLRNILQQAPDVLPQALELLNDEKLIRNSLVLPFRFTTAFDEIVKLDQSMEVRNIVMSLNKALDISCYNVPKFEGRTLVALDESGSMKGRKFEISSLFAAMLVKSNNADLMNFASRARYVMVNPMDSIITIAKSVQFLGQDTNFNEIFKAATRAYDRIVILSDMQSWVIGRTPAREFAEYKKRFNCNPKIYSFDVSGYGTMQFPEANVYALAGVSDKIFDIMKLVEVDKKALINEINKTEL